MIVFWIINAIIILGETDKGFSLLGLILLILHILITKSCKRA